MNEINKDIKKETIAQSKKNILNYTIKSGIIGFSIGELKGLKKSNELNNNVEETTNILGKNTTLLIININSITQKRAIDYNDIYTKIKEWELFYNNKINAPLINIIAISFYLYHNNLTEEKEVEIINNISLLHNNQEIIQLGCKILYDFIKVLINGNSKFKAINNLKEKNYEKYYSQNSIDYYKRIISGNIK